MYSQHIGFLVLFCFYCTFLIELWYQGNVVSSNELESALLFYFLLWIFGKTPQWNPILVWDLFLGRLLNYRFNLNSFKAVQVISSLLSLGSMGFVRNFHPFLLTCQMYKCKVVHIVPLLNFNRCRICYDTPYFIPCIGDLWFIYMKNQLFVLFIFSIVLLFSITSISILYFFSFLLFALCLFCSSFSNFLR